MDQIIHVGLPHFLVVAAILFTLGLLCVVTRRNAIGILMGVELILNAANINFVAFTKYTSASVGGHVFAVFVIVMAAAEAAIALAITLSLFQKSKSIIADENTLLKN
jgi:NADH-quinone oxidoreductase subunit K